jgi:hypothetical protein
MTEAVLEATNATVESTETVDTAATTAAEASTQAADAATAPELTLNDLAVLRQIIEVASQRGAFKAAELEAVGKAFNKLSAFLDAATESAAQG